MDKLSGMSVFVSVVEKGGFSAAARALNITKSSISKQVTALEDHLGVRLLNRTTRTTSLTEQGSLFYERAKRILEELEDAEESLADLQAKPKGTLKMGAPMSFGIMHLSRYLPRFMEEYPDIRVQLELDDRRTDVVEEGFDVVIRIARQLPDSTLMAKKLATSKMMIVASESYLTREGEPDSVADLAGHRCIAYSLSEGNTEWRFADNSTVPVQPVMTANNGQAILESVKAGVGIAVLPAFIVGEDLQKHTLRTLLPAAPLEELTVYAVYPPSSYMPKKLRVFLDYLTECIGKRPYWDMVE